MEFIARIGDWILYLFDRLNRCARCHRFHSMTQPKCPTCWPGYYSRRLLGRG